MGDQAGSFILVAALTPASRALVLPLCRLPERRADHVTLAHGVWPDAFDPAWVPGGSPLGATVRIHAVRLLRSEDVEALTVEIAGSRLRPHDGGVLHLTLSRSAQARSHQANALIAQGEGEPIDLWLEGVVGWRPTQRAP